MTRTTTDPRQLCFNLAPRKRPGRRHTRYDDFIARMRAAFRETGRTPTYGQLGEALGMVDRSNMRKLVMYGKQRGDIAVRLGGGLMVA